VNANQKRALSKLWGGDLTLEEIQEDLGVTRGELLAEAAAMGLPGERPEAAYLPTPEEIRRACAELRMKRTAAEREARLGRMK